MKGYFAYIRVSTVKQGQSGVSLQEQRAIIERFAQTRDLKIISWHEEQETAAKSGRPVFEQLLKKLRRGDGDGLIVHKIDRSARNLRDWADLGDIIDRGIQVHFASDGLDLNTRGGRLSADIQAVVAADFVRNLREETRKGIYGRLKQGLYPLRAPVGYQDCGRGRPKEPDPIQAPLVRQTFELYAAGEFNLRTLEAEMYRRGLRNRRGGRVTRNGLSTILNNPFYMGVIRIRRNGEHYTGVHEPLISATLFKQVQRTLRGKTNAKIQEHQFQHRRLWQCRHCGRTLTGEVQKQQYVYYRCHTSDCVTKCLREEDLEKVVLAELSLVKPDAQEMAVIRFYLAKLRHKQQHIVEKQRQSQQLRQDQVRERLNRLTDAMLDGLIDQEAYTTRKAKLLMEQAELAQCAVGSSATLIEQFEKKFELANMAYSQYKTGNYVEKRSLLKSLTSNLQVDGKNGSVDLLEPFRSIRDRNLSYDCSHKV